MSKSVRIVNHKYLCITFHHKPYFVLVNKTIMIEFCSEHIFDTYDISIMRFSNQFPSLIFSIMNSSSCIAAIHFWSIIASLKLASSCTATLIAHCYIASLIDVREQSGASNRYIYCIFKYQQRILIFLLSHSNSIFYPP